MSVAIWYQSYPSINRQTYSDHFQLNEDEDRLHFFHRLVLIDHCFNYVHKEWSIE